MFLAKKRDEVMQKLRARGVGAAAYWETPVNRMPLYKDLGYAGLKLPTALSAAGHVLSLPVHPGVRPSRDRVCGGGVREGGKGLNPEQVRIRPADTMSTSPAAPARVAVVVPTYNEKENIREFKRRLDPVLESMAGRMTVLFVDDNSPDGTGDEIRSMMGARPAFRLLEREGKKGLGTAYIEGFRQVIERTDPDVVVQMDADLQHPPEILESLVGEVASGRADVAIASRHVKGGSFKGLNWRRRAISKGASWLARTILGLGGQGHDDRLQGAEEERGRVPVGAPSSLDRASSSRWSRSTS